MNITTNAIVSNSEMIKNYKACREKAERLGKIFILKNNQPEAVLFSIAEYERYSVFIEHLETLGEKDMKKVLESWPKISLKDLKNL
jgi:PHD/YefM family antitoxin component YafN of YafNO toxin-antitoxin module